MNSWENIKNNIAKKNGVEMKSSNIRNKIYTNEDIIIMFIFKLNDRYRYSSLIDLGLINDMDKLFTESYDTKTNYYKYAIPKVYNYIDSIKNKINQIKNEKDVKNKPLIFNVEHFFATTEYNIDTTLIATATPRLSDLAKYRYLAKLLYEKDKKYLDYALESIINNNKNTSLDMMVLGVDNITKNKKSKNIEHFENITYDPKIILFLCIILIIFLVIKNWKQ